MSVFGKTNNLSELLSPDDIELLSASGTKLVQQVGIDVIREVVYDVLTGKNLRDSTEVLTRRRIATLNLAMLKMFIKGSSSSSDFIKNLPKIASQTLLNGHVSKADRWIAEWVLGLTDKAFQNVLRDDSDKIIEYRNNYIKICQDLIESHEKEFGILSGEFQLSSGVRAKINWLFMTYLLTTVGSETLAIRGSEKSSYGKFFGNIVLGSLLHILGFKLVPSNYPIKHHGQIDKIFWLSSSDNKRESDATLLYQAGKGVRFDIGFIGRGNPEISLDKVSRFEREISFGRSDWYMATIIIVDTIGKKSRIETMAKEVEGTIIQMSMGYWPQTVAQKLYKVLGYKHELVEMKQSEIGKYLREKLKDVPLNELIRFEEQIEGQNPLVKYTVSENNNIDEH